MHCRPDLMNFMVRQYRPAFITGFTNEVAGPLAREDITTAPWFRNFEHEHDGGFDHFEIKPYGDGELIVIAHYKNGKFWVAGFAAEEGSVAAQGWRYQPHES